MKHLEVLLHERPAGRLFEKPNGNLQFRYHDDYVADPGPPIGHAMPVRTEAFSHRTCMAVLGGVLPEADVRTAVAAFLRVSEHNDFRLLHELGGDCAGALEFLPEGTERRACGIARAIDIDELDEILVNLPKRPLPDDGESGHVRMSLAGAQGKLPVIVTDVGMSLPASGGLPSTHILKPEPASYPGLVENEGFCMLLARMVELRVAPVQRAVTVSGLPYLVVERYDRNLMAAPVERLHQEDMCQALAKLPTEKYQTEGGPTFHDVAELVRHASAVPARDAQHLWDALVFNALIGNCDAHGKNYSLLYDGARPSLAPLYDLVATSIYTELSPRLAMTIGGATTLADLDLRAWARCATSCGYNANYAVERVQALARRTRAVARLAAEQSPGDVTSSIVDGIEDRARRWLDGT